MQFTVGLTNGFLIDQGHEIEAEAIDAIFFGPEFQRVDDELSRHGRFALHLVAAARAVGERAIGISSVIIFRRDGHERRFARAVVVNDVHDHADPPRVEGVDERF